MGARPTLLVTGAYGFLGAKLLATAAEAYDAYGTSSRVPGDSPTRVDNTSGETTALQRQPPF